MQIEETMKPIAVWAADAHLDRNAWTDYPQLYGDSQHSFQYLVKRAIRMEADLFLAGDTIDVRRPTSEVANFVRVEMAKAKTAGVNVLFIQGQHDLSDPPWFHAIHDWPKHLHKERYRVGDFNVYGLDWQPADKLAAALQEVPDGADILMAHQVWEDFMGIKALPEGSFEQVPTDILFTGDYHKYVDAVFRGSRMQKLRVISPGSTNMRAMGEYETKYYVVLYDTGVWKRFVLPTRPFHEEQVNNERQLAAFETRWPKILKALNAKAEKRKLPPHVAKPSLRIVHPGDLPVKKQLRKIVGDDAFVFYRRINVETPEQKQQKIERSQILDRGVNGCLPLVLKQEDPRFKPLSRLLSSADPKTELRAMRKEYFDDPE